MEGMVEVVEKGWMCKRCEHNWIPRKKNIKPVTCPNCKSMTGDFYLHDHYNPELRETGVPAGAICWSCKQREARAKQSIHHVPVSVEVAPGVWVEVDLRPTPEVGDVESGE